MMIKYFGRYRLNIISGILAYMGTYGLAVQVTSAAQGSVNREVFLLPVLVVLYVMYKRIFEIQEGIFHHLFDSNLHFIARLQVEKD